jgi:uncharacterized integral membrane protein
MAKLTSPARSATAQSGPDINNRPRPLPPLSATGPRFAFAASTVVTLLLLIFILQNGQRSDVHFFGAHGHLPMGIALLFAALFGVLLVTMHATVRIIQLRLLARRHGATYTTATHPDPTVPDTNRGAGVQAGPRS